MTDAKAIAFLFVLMGGFFVVLAAEPLAVFDRFDFWAHQARWFRSNKVGGVVGRTFWAAFGLLLWVIAGLALTRRI